MGFTPTNRTSVSEDGVERVPEVSDINITGGATVSDDNDGTATISVSSSGAWQAGDVIRVGTGPTADYELVQDAVNAAKNWDTVFITNNYNADHRAGGTGAETFPITVTNKIKMKGVRGSRTLEGGYDEGSPALIHVDTGGNSSPGFTTEDMFLWSSTGHALLIDGRHTTHYNLHTHYSRGAGVVINDHDASGNATNTHHFFGCKSYQNDSHGYHIDGSSGLSPHNVHWFGCNAYNNGGHGLYIQEGSNYSATGCNFEKNGLRGFVASGSNSVAVRDCYIENNDGGTATAAPILFEDIIGGHFVGNYLNDFGDGKAYAVEVNAKGRGGAPSGNIIAGNVAYQFNQAIVKVTGGRWTYVSSSNIDPRLQTTGNETSVEQLVDDQSGNPDGVLVDGMLGAHNGGINLTTFTPESVAKVGVRAMSDGTGTSGKGVTATWNGTNWLCSDGSTV